MLHYRLGLDMGTNSLGWCAVQVQRDGERWVAIGILDLGVRIFDDGREPAKKEVPGESSAVQRRTARGMRRRYDRKLMRKKSTLRELIKAGLMPEDQTERKKLEALEPLKLRSDALTRQLEPYEIGRALFHLQQRRGFKSNRKESRSNSETVTPMKDAALKLEQLLTQQTLGQYLYERNKGRQTTRFHARKEGSKTLYDFYPTRKLVEEEFNAIWEAQKKYHLRLLSDEAKQAVHHAIFYQRKLKPQPKGHCSIRTDEERMAWAMPTAQHFRIAKEINNLRILRPDDFQYKSREELENRQKLSPEQRETLFKALCAQGSMTFKQIRKTLGIDSTTTFNLETPHREKLLGDETAARMRGGKKKGEVFPGWDNLKLEQQDGIIAKLICDDPKDPNYLEDEDLAAWLSEHYGLAPEHAEKVMEAPLPASYAKFGKTVITKILPKMQGKGLMEHDALIACGYNPGDQYTGEICEKLPYYGELLEGHVVRNEKSSDPMVREYGRVANPTVHIALNQLKRLMNTIKGRYGCWPQEIVVEMTRELKKGRTEIAEIIREIEKNTKQRDTWRKEIAERCSIPEENISDYDLAKMKLWYELEGDATHRKCVFSGEMISLTRLFDDVEIEHILPRSQTLDNTSANKTLATREANRLKANQIPYEAFKNMTGKYAYEAIWERAQALPKSKRWRFLPDAMERFTAKGDFAARQLNDTSYMARLATKYLAYSCEQGKDGVRVTPGALTGLLRKAWGLNALLGDDEEKNRNDHRHHAIDALVIALTDIRTVQQVQRAAAREEEERAKGNDAISVKKVLGKEKPAIISDWNALKEAVDRIIVSHKPDHGSPAQHGGGTSGRLHEDTYYGYVGEGDKKGTLKLVLRVPLLSLKNAGELDGIRDKELRDALQQFVYEHEGSFEEALRAFSVGNHQWKGIHSVRVLKEKSTDSMISVKKRNDGLPWKVAQGGSNQRAEIYCPKSGKKAGKWQMEVIKSFDANQKDFVPAWRMEHPDADLVMTLHMNDIVAYEEDGNHTVSRVRKLNSIGQVVLVDPRRAKLENAEGWVASANQLQLKNTRPLYVKVDGSVYDPLGELTTPRVSPRVTA